MKEFIIRGKTADFKTSGDTHTINFSGHKGDYGFKLLEFKLYPSANIGTAHAELCGCITAGKTPLDPENPDFTDEALIATSTAVIQSGIESFTPYTVVNDTFVITQDLILTVTDTSVAAGINWQCKFMPVKLSTTEAALTNYRQFSIFDE